MSLGPRQSQTPDAPCGLGVLGGMGPLVSAEFLDTLYALARGRTEQEGPVVLLYSNPQVPDRTNTFLAGDSAAEEHMLRLLENGLRRLCQPGIERLVIACVTMHYLFDRLPDDLKQKAYSLIEIVLETVAKRQRKHLLLATQGTRRLQLFENHPAWDRAKESILWPEESDQDRVHAAIYHVKTHHDSKPLVDLVAELADRHEVDNVIAGCTEFHLVAKHFPLALETRTVHLLDPLTRVARDWVANDLVGDR